MELFLKRAKDSARVIATIDGKRKSGILNQMADEIISQKDKIKEANRADMVLVTKIIYPLH